MQPLPKTGKNGKSRVHRQPGPPFRRSEERLGGFLSFNRPGRADFDGSRLHGLGQFTNELDIEKSVNQVRRLYLDVIGKLETALKRTPRNPLTSATKARNPAGVMSS